VSGLGLTENRAWPLSGLADAPPNMQLGTIRPAEWPLPAMLVPRFKATEACNLDIIPLPLSLS
jgi:hypothetical protein